MSEVSLYNKPDIWFYQLERSSIEETLPQLLEKCLERSWRSAVVSPNSDRLEAIDASLWTSRPGSWLPHGLARNANAERQPILLRLPEERVANDAQALFLLDGATLTEWQGLARIFVIFSSVDEESLGKARADWKSYKAQGFQQSYWRQDEAGKWVKQA